MEVDPDAPVTHRYFAEYLAKAQADRDILLALIQENTRAAREDREAIQRKFDMLFERMEAHDKELKEERARNEESKKARELIVERLDAHDKELQHEHAKHEEAKNERIEIFERLELHDKELKEEYTKNEEAKKEREVIVERLEAHDKEINLHREEQKKSEEAKKGREEKRTQMQIEWEIGNYWAYFLSFASIHAGASDCGRRYHVKVE